MISNLFSLESNVETRVREWLNHKLNLQLPPITQAYVATQEPLFWEETGPISSPYGSNCLAEPGNDGWVCQTTVSPHVFQEWRCYIFEWHSRKADRYFQLLLRDPRDRSQTVPDWELQTLIYQRGGEVRTDFPKDEWADILDLHPIDTMATFRLSVPRKHKTFRPLESYDLDSVMHILDYVSSVWRFS